MKLLLDTHVWVWSQDDPSRLGLKTRKILMNIENSIAVSVVSTLEIARLAALGRLRFSMEVTQWVNKSLRLLQASTVSITHEIAIEAYRFPEPFHKDPADRLLVSTARVGGFQIITADERILIYPHVSSIDARR